MANHNNNAATDTGRNMNIIDITDMSDADLDTLLSGDTVALRVGSIVSGPVYTTVYGRVEALAGDCATVRWEATGGTWGAPARTARENVRSLTAVFS